MNTLLLPLRSPDMLSLAELLRHNGSALLAEATDREDEWSTLAATAVGAGFEQGFEQLSRQHAPLPQAAGQIAQVSDVLREVAGLLIPWEELLDRILPVAEALGEYHPGVAVMLQQVAAAAQLLDFMCAREISARCAAEVPPPAQTFADFQGLSTTAIHEYHLPNLPPELAQLVSHQPDLQVLEVGDGTFVATLGDLDTADAVVTIAAGTGSAAPESWPTYVDRARTISQTTGAATVLWLGHPAPATVPEALSRIPAEQAAPKLRGFQAELARRHPGQHRVMLGYSYGSVVVGRAATPTGPGLAADDVVLVGSPGVGVHRAAQLHLDSSEPRVHAVTGSADPIGLSATAFGGVHGIDPTSRSFGATVWESPADHSEYWNDPQFLGRLRAVVAGR